LHAKTRANFKEYSVEAISLNELLLECDAPKKMGYLSIDTEGSELEILLAFDFGSFEFELITVEHNFNMNQNKIHDLLISQGYERILEEFSGGDGWYINSHTSTRLATQKFH